MTQALKTSQLELQKLFPQLHSLAEVKNPQWCHLLQLSWRWTSFIYVQTSTPAALLQRGVYILFKKKNMAPSTQMKNMKTLLPL